MSKIVSGRGLPIGRPLAAIYTNAHEKLRNPLLGAA